MIANNAIYSESGTALQLAGDLGGLMVAGNVGTGSTPGVSSSFDGTEDLTTDFVPGALGGAAPIAERSRECDGQGMGSGGGKGGAGR